MDKHVRDFICDKADLCITSEYSFRDICGFTFAFKTEIVHIKNRISSASAAPVGIIYKENNEFYLAPLAKKINVSEVIMHYVKYHMD